jgi:hypothetical protein
MEDLENARSSAAKGFDHDKKRQVVESSETQITPSTGGRLSLSQRIAEKLKAWGIESRGEISCYSSFEIGSVSNRRAFFFPHGVNLIRVAWILTYL